MLSRSVRSLASLQRVLFQQKHAGLATRLHYTFSNKQNNGDDSEKAPDGFEKFKRKSKKNIENEDIPKVNKEPVKEQTASASVKEEKPKVDEKVQENKTKEQTIKVEEEKENPQKEQETLKNEESEKKPTKKKQEKQGWMFQNLFTKEEKKDEKKQDENSEKNEENDKKEDNKEDEYSFKKMINDFLNKGNNKAYVITALAVALIAPPLLYQYQQRQLISYTEFVRNYLQSDNVQSIYIQRYPAGNNSKTFAKIITKDGSTKKIVLGNVDHFLEQVEAYQVEKGREADNLIPIQFEYLSDVSKMLDSSFSWLSTMASVALAVIFYKQLKSGIGGMKGGSGGGSDIFGMGKSNVKVFGIDSKVNTRFKDVAGQDEAKLEITEFVDFLKKPQKYKAIGAKLPKGALLTGPPGTGKTLLAKACAGEAGVPFFFISGSDFVEMFVGVGASRVRDLFKQAKAKSPSIIFIDEIDAVGRKRENKMGGNDERDNTLNQLLVEMDGFGTDANVIVLAATNRKELLDPALTRPGRFDRQIEVTNPDIDGRKQIFMVHLKSLKLHPSRTMDEYSKRLAALTPGFSGADIMNLCNEAAIMAARKNKKFIESIDFELASERVIAGLEKKRIVSEEERRIVAVHESGHAVTSWFLEGGHPLLKLTIIPRTKGSLGFAQYLPNESSLESKEELLDRLCTILGGRCAEEEFFGRITTGAYDDLKRAYELCHALVTKYGMSTKLGFVGYIENDYSKTYSDATNTLIDEEIKLLIDEATAKTRGLIKQYRAQIEGLSGKLLEKETLDLRQIIEVLGNRPFPPKSNYKAYLELQTEEEVKQEEDAAKTEETQPKEETETKTASV